MAQPTDTVHFQCGAVMKNRFMLAPLTNKQSHEDGRLSDDEFYWLVKRAEGGFGLIMTCATSVQFEGRCWHGQLGIYSDRHINGHRRLSSAIQEKGALAIVQLHHGGMRCPPDAIGGAQPVAPSYNKEFSAREMSLNEVYQLRDDFITCAERAQIAGYNGVEVHGAHGYLITQFISSSLNHRDDIYGGDLEGRCRLLMEIIEGIRMKCGPEFILGVRLSPERFGMRREEVFTLAQWLIDTEHIDFLDLSLWDVHKEGEYGETLIDFFSKLNRKAVQITVAGKISTAKDVHHVLHKGIDFVTIGKSTILHHDFPTLVLKNDEFSPIETPVDSKHLESEGVGPAFLNY